MSDRLTELRRSRPRSVFLRRSIVALCVLVAISWASGIVGFWFSKSSTGK